MTDPVEAQLRARELERIAALLAADVPRLRELHSPDYQLLTPTGRAFTRDRYLGMIESGDLRYTRWAPGAMAVRASATMGIVRYRATLALGDGDAPGTPFECWHTDSYELGAASWRAVWSQATRIAP
jgi:hypothetical protein